MTGVGRASQLIPGLALVATLVGASAAGAQVIEVGAAGEVSSFSGPTQTLDGARRPIAPAQPPLPASSGRSRATPTSAVAQALQTSADRSQLSARLMEAVAWQESRFRQTAVSKKGARGVMQLMPETARQLGVDASDLGGNVQGGTAYMARLLQRFDGDVILALAAYNAGPEAVRRFGGVPPYPETRAFVAAVLDRLSMAAKAPLEPLIR